ncbi:MAG: c-type cytochrome [Burkholderiales bacterium]|nr:c-type cytochrome [Burkholderiales bacterium]
MKRSLLTTLMILLAASTLSAMANDPASVVRGGRLYDNWIAETKARAPNQTNPAFKNKSLRVAAPDTWRCVECHGWDYKGKHGLKGIQGYQKANAAAFATLLKDANHGYEELLDEHDRIDLANFVSSGQTDMNRLVGQARNVKPGQTTAHKVFATVCAVCHGMEGDRLREIAPLGDSARQRPAEMLHVSLNGHPGGNMPALRTLGEETAVNMLAYLQTLRGLDLVASVANGGRLYDDWQAHTGGQRQALAHPAYPPNASFANAANETWRCKECHGWDYKGNQGQYAKGSHVTGIVGIRAMVGTDPSKSLAVLRGPSHRFSAVLKHRDLQDLANFVSYGQVDMDTVIDPKNGLSRGDASKGQPLYRTMCANCHGLDGYFVAKRHLGKVSRGDPWHSLHNMLNGHPDDTMPALRELDPNVPRDILAHIQTLQERR